MELLKLNIILFLLPSQIHHATRACDDYNGRRDWPGWWFRGPACKVVYAAKATKYGIVKTARRCSECYAVLKRGVKNAKGKTSSAHLTHLPIFH